MGHWKPRLPTLPLAVAIILGPGLVGCDTGGQSELSARDIADVIAYVRELFP